MFNTPDGCPDIWNEDNCECPVINNLIFFQYWSKSPFLHQF